MAQREFADCIGENYSRYAYYELGYADMLVNVLVKICLFCGVSADNILEISK